MIIRRLSVLRYLQDQRIYQIERESVYMKKLQFGQVVFFKYKPPGREFGYVQPDTARNDGKSYYFKLSTALYIFQY